MKIVRRIAEGRPTWTVDITDEERMEFEALAKDPRFKLWREYISMHAGIRKKELFGRVLEGTRDYDPTAGVAYMAAMQELTDLAGLGGPKKP